MAGRPAGWCNTRSTVTAATALDKLRAATWRVRLSVDNVFDHDYAVSTSFVRDPLFSCLVTNSGNFRIGIGARLKGFNNGFIEEVSSAILMCYDCHFSPVALFSYDLMVQISPLLIEAGPQRYK